MLQANAGWKSGYAAECGDQLIEGSAEYFGQMYAFGEINTPGLGDILDALSDPVRFYNYEVGARAFEALIGWQGEQKAVQFWELADSRCADAFLRVFGVAPGSKCEEDWENLTGN